MDAALPGIFPGHPTEEPAEVSGRKARFENQVSLKDLEAAGIPARGSAEAFVGFWRRTAAYGEKAR